MAKLERSLRREKQIQRRKNGHQVDNKGIFLLEEQKVKRKQEIQRLRKEKEDQESI